MYKVADFIEWAVTHVNPYTVPHDAALARPWNECGGEPWNYLFGSVRVRTDQATLNRYFENHYKNQMTRERYDALTADWPRDGYATDCQGLCDAWLTYEKREPTDINADMNYRLWCTGKGTVGEIERPYVVGEAVFMVNSASKMTHVGWVCGFAPDGEPLIVEARGIAYGVVVTRLSRRDFTHRGLMTAKFDYSAADKPQEENPMEPIVLKRTSPMMQGDGIRLMQQALNALGYTDDAGRQLDEDGKCGNCTMQAVHRFAEAHAEPQTITVEIKPVTTMTTDDGLFKWFMFRAEDLPEGLK